MYNKYCDKQIMTSWGFSSAGRAPALHAGGQEFESPNLHHLKQMELLKNNKTFNNLEYMENKVNDEQTLIM